MDTEDSHSYEISNTAAIMTGFFYAFCFSPIYFLNSFWGWVVSVVVWILIDLAFVANTKKHSRITVDEEGIHGTIYWHLRSTIKWDEIKMVKYNFFFTFRVKDRDRTLIVPLEALSDDYFINLVKKETNLENPLRTFVEKRLAEDMTAGLP